MTPHSAVYNLKLVTWLQVTVIVALIVASHISLRSDIRSEAMLNQATITRLNIQVIDLREELLSMKQQQIAQCLQYESDMDRFFREHPEFHRHPWVCQAPR